ncbi:hypothetical protein C8K36_101443 [Rhodococcus sp. OK519]|nr:hypothetical protein C8K36_101443 [Rhodococcus sp. OK519]
MKRSGRKPNPLNSLKQISDETHIRALDGANVEWIPDGPVPGTDPDANAGADQPVAAARR